MKQLRDNLDRISGLPDSILCHILSFLPTEDAVATSFLSTKWKYLWTIIPNVSLADEYFPKNTNFATFVNRVLLFHNAHSIDKFSLNCHRENEDYASYDSHAWVTWAILKNAREVELVFKGGTDVFSQLPVSLFTCQMLEVLKLEGVIIEVPTTLRLPKLKCLELIEVFYDNEESACNLISSCASLKSLYIRRIQQDGIDALTISSFTLEVLSIEASHNFDENELLMFVINVPPLQYLCIRDCSVCGFLIEDSTSLVKVNISDIDADVEYSVNNYVELNSHVARFLQGICSAQSFCLEGEIFWSSIPANLFQKFDRLTELKAKTKCCQWSLLQGFIENSGRLNHLSFTKGRCCHNVEERITCWINPTSVPECLLTSLKRMSFIGLEGFEDELAMVEYILQNGRVLNSLEIIVSPSLYDKRKVTLLQKLLKFRRLSVSCEIIIS